MTTTATKQDMELISHLLRRAGFGASYEELERYASQGYEATVEELLNPESQPSVEDDLIYRRHIGWQYRPTQGGEYYWAFRMINTGRPLEEKITVFWHGIHCTGVSKIEDAGAMTATINMFRTYGLGSFRDLLVQLAHDPGMLYYLDNCQSHRGAINENWARELLELFSMGVGNYTEPDIKEAARAFTGWTCAPIAPIYPYARTDWEFLYDTSDHDEGEKVFLGQLGRFNGDDAVEIICQQPATARFIARHLYNFFVADEPQVPAWQNTPPQDPGAIKMLEDEYFRSNYNIRSMLRVLFSSDSFKNARFQKVKSPTEVLVNTLRLTKEFTDYRPNFTDTVLRCGYMGQELMNPPTVEGWHTGQEWIDSGTLVERVNFAAEELGDVNKPGVQEMVQRIRAKGTTIGPDVFVDTCVEQLGGVAISGETREGLIEQARKGGPIDTGAQEFASRVGLMMQLITSCKEFHFG